MMNKIISFIFIEYTPCVKINVGLIALVTLHFMAWKAETLFKNPLCRRKKLRQQQGYFEKHDITLTVVTHYVYKHNTTTNKNKQLLA